MIMRKEGYTVQPFIYRPSAKTIFIKYNGENHFEPLLPKFDVKSPIPMSPRETYLDTAKSVSSETRKMIEEIDKGRGKKSTKFRKKRVKNNTRKRKRKGKGKKAPRHRK